MTIRICKHCKRRETRQPIRLAAVIVGVCNTCNYRIVSEQRSGRVIHRKSKMSLKLQVFSSKPR